MAESSFNRSMICVCRARMPGGKLVPAVREDSLEQRIGTRMRSRLYEMCRTVEVYAPDFRREKTQAGRARA